jgi:polyisoprenoid-binding protein YceI
VRARAAAAQGLRARRGAAQSFAGIEAALTVGMTKPRQLFVASLVAALAAAATGRAEAPAAKAPAGRSQYRIDAKKSRFIVETETAGLSSMFAHDHKIEVGDFGGVASFSTAGFSAASLELTAKAASLRLVGENNVGERQAVESALREDVLETAKYPEISFKSKKVTATRRGDGTWDVRLAGDLTLHGVKRPVTLPARASLEGDTLHAIGAFELRQTDYGITPFSFVKGTVAIKDVVTLSFDIVAPRS